MVEQDGKTSHDVMGGRAGVRRWLVVAGVGVLVVGVLLGLLVFRQGGSAGESPESLGTPGPAECPASYPAEGPVAHVARGDLVPSGATKAILCSYPQRQPYPLALGGAIVLPAPTDELTNYLSGLPGPDEDVCGGGRTEYAIAFEYSNRKPAVVLLGCYFQRDNYVRGGGDIRKVLAFWRVSLTG